MTKITAMKIFNPKVFPYGCRYDNEEFIIVMVDITEFAFIPRTSR